MRGLFTASLVLTLTYVSSALAQSADDDVGWGADAGSDAVAFDDVDVGSDADVDAARPGTSRVYFGGYLRSDWATWLRRLKSLPFAKGRQSLDLELRARNYYLRLVLGVHVMYDVAYRVDQSQYSPPIRDAYEWLVRSRESYLSLVGPRVEFAVGAQKVALGSGELISVLDVLNPRDDREPGLTDIEDRRLPILMTKLSVFWKRHRLEFIGTHEGFYRLRPPTLAPFSPFRKVATDDAAFGTFVQLNGGMRANVNFVDDAGRFASRYNQGLARWTYSGSGVELGLMAGSVVEYPGVVQFDTTGNNIVLPIELTVQHPRYTIVGFSFAKPINAWMIHAEIAGDINRAVQTADLQPSTPDPVTFSFERRHFVRWLIGLRYADISRGTTFTIEYRQGTVGDVFQDEYETPALLPINPATVAARWQQLFAGGDHGLEIVSAAFGPRFLGGGFARVQFMHKLHDDVRLTWGYIGYFPGKERSPIYGFEKNDRAFARLRWDFAVE